MAGEGKNLLTRTLATAADDSMQLYVVYNGRDYRVLLSTLLSLITKTRLGLENVNNTSDLDKPISTATQQALLQKVDAADVVSREEWNLFVQQFGNVVSLETLTQAVDSLQLAIQSKASIQEVQTAINAALQPITNALMMLQNDVSSITQQLGDYATKVELSTAIAAVNSVISSLNMAFMSYMASNDARVSTLEDRVTVLEENQIVLGPHFW